MKDNISLRHAMRIQIFTKTILFFIFISSIIQAQYKELDWKPELSKYKGKVNTNNDLPLLVVYSELNLIFPDNERFTVPNGVERSKIGSLYEYKLFVNVKEKTVLLKVASEGFGEILTIEVNGLGPKINKFYSVFEKTSSKLNMELGEYFLTTNPIGAKISILGQPKFTEVTPFNFKDFTATSYKVTLEKEDYYKVDTTITIQKDRKQSLNVQLKAKFGYLKVNTDRDYKLFIDGSETSYDVPIKIDEGIRNIEVKKKYFKNLVETIVVEGKYEPMIIEKKYVLEPYYGKLNVRSNIYGATVLLNGEEVGTTPFQRVIAAGKYNLEIKKDKYRTEKFQFEILRDEAKDTLVELKQYGTLKIVGPNSTKITINGGVKGYLPNASSYELPPGDYEVKAELAGCDSEVYSFYLETETKILEINPIETEDRPFRISAFGNERLNQFTPGIRFMVSGYLETINPNLLSTATNSPIYESMKGNFLIGAGLSFTHFPFLIETDVNWSGPLSKGGVEKLWLITAKLGYCPFVFYERIFPYIGIMAHIAKLDVSRDKNSDGGLWHTDPVLFFNIAFRYYGNGKITVGYKKFFKNDAFDDGFYVSWIF